MLYICKNINAMKFIAYYRVSTEKQGASGLGLEAQREAVLNYIKPENVYREFTEVESGRKKDRPILLEALQVCKDMNATLVIAKLDRLARNVAFVSALLESGVKFVCCDMPTANELTIHIYSAIAQDEAKRISTRTKDALAIKKMQGYKLGKPENLTQEARLKGANTMRTKANENTNNQRARAFLSLLSGTLQFKALQLNENGFRTAKNKEFTPMQVKRLLTPK
jgi:DNA invertase Pin-like site-specific DNA recombinase